MPTRIEYTAKPGKGNKYSGPRHGSFLLWQTHSPSAALEAHLKYMASEPFDEPYYVVRQRVEQLCRKICKVTLGFNSPELMGPMHTEVRDVAIPCSSNSDLLLALEMLFRDEPYLNYIQVEHASGMPTQLITVNPHDRKKNPRKKESQP